MPSEEEIKRIIDLWNDNKSYGEIARELNGPKSTIQSWIKSLLNEGKIVPRTDTVRMNTKKATEAKATYDRERRLALNDLWFEKIEAMLLAATDANTLRALATPYGVASDKRALLEPSDKDKSKTGLEEMLEAIHAERQSHDLETSTN